MGGGGSAVRESNITALFFRENCIYQFEFKYLVFAKKSFFPKTASINSGKGQ